MPPEQPSPAQIAFAVIGLLCVAASTVLAFQSPFGTWHWVLLLVAGGCLLVVRRMRR